MPMTKARACLLGGLLILWSALALAVQPLEIKAVVVDDTADPVVLMVYGEHFLNGSDLELWLGEDIQLSVDLTTLADTSVTATLPPGDYQGSYQLIAMTGGGTVRFDDFDGVTIGAEGPQGIPGLPGADSTVPGPQGEQGIQGIQGEQGLPGADGEDGTPGQDGLNGSNGLDGANCFDDIGDSVADCIGPQGDQGPPGEQGVPGNLALAGMSCPIGEFMRGFDVTGGILCGLPDGSIENPYPNCGNGVLDPGEVCDGTVGLQTCGEIYGPGDWAGVVQCNEDCRDYSDSCTLPW